MIKNRYIAVDGLRGVAVLLMVIYHFTFDLNYFHQVQIDFYHDPLWLNFRTLIVSIFLGLVGVSLYLATRNGFNRTAYLRRLFLLVLNASLVSLGSYLVFPESMIYFGILHFIVVASLVGVWMVRFYWLNLVTGIILVGIGVVAQHAVFDHPMLHWVGLMTHKPITEDYVPFLPWFGVVLIGLFAGKLFFSNEPLSSVLRWPAEQAAVRALALAGRHSLLIYMVHQPLMIGVMFMIWGNGLP